MNSRNQSTEEQHPVEQPGLSGLREVVENYLVQVPLRRASFRHDVIAGLDSAVSNVPDGLATGLLAGVNPVYGLYAAILGPIVGGVLSSTRLMMITTTSASALATGQALASVPVEARDGALVTMVILIGGIQVLFGVLRLGWLTHFVSYSVMTGFLTGIAVQLVLSQLPTITGYQPVGGNAVIRAIDLLLHPREVHLLSLAVAFLTLVLAFTLPRTRLGSLGILFAIVIPSLAVVLLGFEDVRLVRDVGEISSGFPVPAMPSLAGLTFGVATGALAVATIVLVQGAGVSQSVPNPDGERRSASRDFVAQGAANLASGLFHGLPVGGSFGATALNIIYGARTRWAAVFAGLGMAAIVLVFPGLVSSVAMPALGAVIVLAGLRSIRVAELFSVWITGWPSRMAAVTTFLSTLVLPIQAAVGVGVALSTVLVIYAASTDVVVVELVEHPDGQLEERRAPKQLPSHQATVLDVYGHLFYAGARTLEGLLPSPRDAQRPAVILRLRGRPTLGATLIDVLSDYAERLRAVNGRLYLVGVSEGARDQLVRMGKLHLLGPVHIYEATPYVGESTRRALADAQVWLVEHDEEIASPRGA